MFMKYLSKGWNQRFKIVNSLYITLIRITGQMYVAL